MVISTRWPAPGRKGIGRKLPAATCMAVLALGPALALSASAGTPPLGTALPQKVFVAACGSLEVGRLRGLLARELQAHPELVVASPGEVCAALEAARPLPWTPHLIVRELALSYQGRSFLRQSVTFRPEVVTAQVLIQGRRFKVSPTAATLDLPPSEGTPSPNDGLVRALVRTMVHRSQAGSSPPQRSDPGAERIRTEERDLTVRLLAEADSLELERAAPVTSAVLKQLAAILVLEGACSADTAAGLLRSAARLCPFSAEARSAAALAQLREAYHPTVCPRAIQQELLGSVAQNLWSRASVDGLARTYELTVNAPPSGITRENSIDPDHAATQLATVWQGAQPESPHGWEVGLGLGLSKAQSKDLRDVQTMTPGGRIELTRARDGPGFGLKLALGLPWSREVPLAGGSVSWTRIMGSLGARYRLRLGPTHAEGQLGLLLGVAIARGHDFTEPQSRSFSDAGLDAGGEVGGRVIFAHLGGFALWAGGTASTYLGRRLPRWPNLTLQAAGDSQELPSWEITALLGLSRFFTWH